MNSFVDLKGKTFLSLKISKDKSEISFSCDDGSVYRLVHRQDCCEDVRLEDICGDLDDLIGTPILLAEEVSYEQVNPEGVPVPEYQDFFTWTFYKLDTIKGGVTLRWYGESNGYYSEDVNFEELINGKWKF